MRKPSSRPSQLGSRLYRDLLGKKFWIERGPPAVLLGVCVRQWPARIRRSKMRTPTCVLCQYTHAELALAFR